MKSYLGGAIWKAERSVLVAIILLWAIFVLLTYHALNHSFHGAASGAILPSIMSTDVSPDTCRASEAKAAGERFWSKTLSRK